MYICKCLSKINYPLYTMETTSRICIACHKKLRGRADKRYCDERCRNAYNNNRNLLERPIKDINYILRRNRKILENELNKKSAQRKTTRSRLARLGFSFTYFTHFFSIDGNTWHFTYEYGYRAGDNDEILLVKQQDENW
jgi:hypothetical protein